MLHIFSSFTSHHACGAHAYAPRAVLIDQGAAVPVPAHADRPLATGDAAIAQAGTLQLKTRVKHIDDNHIAWLSPAFRLGGSRVRENSASAISPVFLR